MSRGWYHVLHVGAATRTAAGVASGGLRIGYYQSGQLIVRIHGLAGAGAFLVPFWQSSVGGTFWGTLVKGVTASATGTYIVAPTTPHLGNWARLRWTQSDMGGKMSAAYVFRE